MTAAEDLRSVNMYITDYIKFADAKAGTVLTFTSIIGAVVGVTGPEILKLARTVNSLTFAVGIGCCACVAVCTLCVLYHVSHAVSPKVPSANQSLVSFPDIAQMGVPEYVNRALGQPLLEEEYAKHNATLSQIAMSKFDAISRAIWWCRLAFFFAYCTVILYAVVATIRN